MTDDKSQPDKLKEAARDLERDEEETRWEDKLRKLARQKPALEKPE